jgi:hypothetical protein
MAETVDHNKKRNVGLVVEFITRYISRMLVEGNVDKANIAIATLRRHIRPGTELHKEYRLFNALSSSSLSNEMIAMTVLREAREACKRHDAEKLDREKSSLIRELNHKLNDSTLYETKVPEYKTYATIQTLLNDWRSAEPNPVRLAKFEERVVKHLISERTDINLNDHVDQDVDGLVVKLMTEKFNGRYGNMTTIQKQIISEYVTPSSSDDGLRLMGILEGVRSEAIDIISKKSSDLSMTQYVKEKMASVQEMILNEDISIPRDGTIIRFLGVSQLIDELKNGEID